MMQTWLTTILDARARQVLPATSSKRIVGPLAETARDEILNFLSERPLHTVIMSGWILDHGVVSPLHRGTFYGYRNEVGELEGVGLIGHTTMFEARSASAASAFGEIASTDPTVQAVFAEPDPLKNFWNSYSRSGRLPRRRCNELLYECRLPIRSSANEDLCTATMAELDQIEAAHAEMVKLETGIDPLDSDRDGFRRRIGNRIKAKRIWVSMRNGELAFKADVIAETPKVIYFEGVWLNPSYRGRNLSRHFMSGLANAVVRGRSACFFVNTGNHPGSRLYSQLGCNPVASYVKYLL